MRYTSGPGFDSWWRPNIFNSVFKKNGERERIHLLSKRRLRKKLWNNKQIYKKKSPNKFNNYWQSNLKVAIDRYENVLWGILDAILYYFQYNYLNISFHTHIHLHAWPPSSFPQHIYTHTHTHTLHTNTPTVLLDIWPEMVHIDGILSSNNSNNFCEKNVWAHIH